MKVALLTMFNGLSKNYSLSNVVEEQLKMLLKHDIKVKMLVCEQFDDNSKFGIFLDENIEWIKIINTFNGKQIHWYDYSKSDCTLHQSFFDEAQLIACDFENALQDVNVCIMHDILYQGWHYVHNVAIRIAQQKLEHVKFLSFTHSFPSNRPPSPSEQMKYRYIPMPNTVFVYPSYSGLAALAKQYNVPEGLCRVVYNNISLLDNFSKATKELNDKVNLLDSDILIIYPARLTTGKHPEKIAALAGSIYTMTEKTVKVVYCDFDSMDIDPKAYRDAIKVVGESFGLDPKNIIFTAQQGFENGFPHESVMELFSLSNLFICPSMSESFGLTVIEAASKGNFIVLNKNVPALDELGKTLKAYFMEWDARVCGCELKTNHKPSEAAYYAEHAKRIVNLMNDNNVLWAKNQVKQRFSNDWIWKNQLEPLIFTNL